MRESMIALDDVIKFNIYKMLAISDAYALSTTSFTYYHFFTHSELLWLHFLKQQDTETINHIRQYDNKSTHQRYTCLKTIKTRFGLWNDIVSLNLITCLNLSSEYIYMTSVPLQEMLLIQLKSYKIIVF